MSGGKAGSKDRRRFNGGHRDPCWHRPVDGDEELIEMPSISVEWGGRCLLCSDQDWPSVMEQLVAEFRGWA